MRKLLLRLITGALLTWGMSGEVLASNETAMEARIHEIELRWEQIKFMEDGAPDQFDHMAALAHTAAALAKDYSDRVEPLIWEGILVSEEAGMAGALKALGYAKRAKAILEDVYAKDPAALDAGAPTSLGVLYYRVPGWPLGFGDNKKARALLKQAVSLAPNGMDANYFYADFLMTQNEYAAAYKVLKHALSLPAEADRPLWDRNRRAVIRELMSKAKLARARAD